MMHGHIALTASRFIVPGKHRYPFQQGRLAGPVLAGDDGDGSVETQLEPIAQKRQAKRISIAVRHPVGVEPNLPEVRRGQSAWLSFECHSRSRITTWERGYRERGQTIPPSRL